MPGFGSFGLPLLSRFRTGAPGVLIGVEFSVQQMRRVRKNNSTKPSHSIKKNIWRKHSPYMKKYSRRSPGDSR